jgi:hypothetical protein
MLPHSLLVVGALAALSLLLARCAAPLLLVSLTGSTTMAGTISR